MSRYVHIERVTNNCWRLSVLVDLPGLMEWLRALRGRGLYLCERVVEHGHAVTKTTELDKADYGGELYTLLPRHFRLYLEPEKGCKS